MSCSMPGRGGGAGDELERRLHDAPQPRSVQNAGEARSHLLSGCLHASFGGRRVDYDYMCCRAPYISNLKTSPRPGDSHLSWANRVVLRTPKREIEESTSVLFGCLHVCFGGRKVD